MKRSEMVKRMTEQWLGLWKNELPGENIDNETYDAVFVAMDSLLAGMEWRGILPPYHEKKEEENYQIKTTTSELACFYTWEKE